MISFRCLLPLIGCLSVLVLTAPAQQRSPVALVTPPSATVAPTDVLLLLDGTELPARVEEVTPELVKYRRLDNPMGPLLAIGRAQLFMIRFANGTREVMGVPADRVAAPETASAVDPLIERLYQLGRRAAGDAQYIARQGGRLAPPLPPPIPIVVPAGAAADEARAAYSQGYHDQWQAEPAPSPTAITQLQRERVRRGWLTAASLLLVAFYVSLLASVDQ